MADPSGRKAATAESFGEATEGYTESRMHREGRDLDRLASWCADRAVALDIATGAGHTAGALREAGVDRIVASDASPAMVSTAVDSYPAVIGVVADAERLPFGDGTFDAVTCRIAAHHFPDPRTFVKEVARVLQPGGVFAFEDNVAPEDDDLARYLNRLEAMRDPTHVESYKLSTWERWLREAEFAVEERQQMMKPIEYDPWVNRIDALDAEDRSEVHRFLLEAPGEAVDFFEIAAGEEGVETFGSLKGLIRATRVG